MKIRKHSIHYTEHPLNIRIVVDSNSSYWAIDAAHHLIHNNKVICSLANHIPFDEDNWIHFYRLDENYLIVIDGAIMNTDNLWIIDNKGQIIRSFSVGNNFSKIYVQERKIIIAYDYMSAGFEEQRIAIFDEFGNFLKKFDIGEIDLIAKSFCKKSKNEVIIQAYDNFNIQVLNLNTFEIKTYQFLNNPSLYASQFVLYSPTTEYIYLGSKANFMKRPDDPNSLYLNVFRGKLDEVTQSIRFDFFEKLDYSSHYISLNKSQVLQVNSNVDWVNTEEPFYAIIDFEID
jgi:hypothetical protein